MKESIQLASHRHWPQWVVILLLWLTFAQAAGAASRTSLTIDEGLHITSGYSIWRTGDYRLVEEHPPLLKLIATWPLRLIPDLPSPQGLPGWRSSNLVRVMKNWLQPYRPFDRIVLAARVPMMLLALALGAAVYRWAADLAGARAGLLALGIYALDPNILAHAPIAATDLGAAALMFFATYTFWRALRRPTRANVILAGLALGFAQAAKISALILIPWFATLAGIRALTANEPASRPKRLARLGLLTGAVMALASVTLWAVYGFELRPPPGWSIPLPAASHLIPFQRVQADLSAGRPTFLMGEISERGWWYYFPVAFALKTPLPTLFLLLASIVGLVHVRQRPASSDVFNLAALLLFPLGYFAAAMMQPFNIGYRHLLPVLPFMFVFIGVQGASGRWKVESGKQKAARFLPSTFYLLLFTWYTLSAIAIFPNHLAYFNELAGGPGGGYRYLVDSNLDWGQSWKELKAYMDAEGIARIKFAQYSSNDPAVYGIVYEPIAPMEGAPPVLPARFSPEPGVYVINATSLQGLLLADSNTYNYFRHRTPTARIGHTLFVYNVEPIEPPHRWVASCAAPTPPLEPQDIMQGFEQDDLRLLYFDCQQSWVFPGDSPRGWAILPYAEAHANNTFARRWLKQSELNFEQKQSAGLPPHSIFVSSGAEALPEIAGLVPISATVKGTAALLGYTLEPATVRPGQSVELVTFWRVLGQPARLLSVMAHAVGANGQAIAVGDGLGLPIEQWQAGDILAQRHLLTLPPDAAPGALEIYTGMYTLPDVQRLAITQNGKIIGDSVKLATVNVQP